jgi:hypothetical protein
MTLDHTKNIMDYYGLQPKMFIIMQKTGKMQDNLLPMPALPKNFPAESG